MGEQLPSVKRGDWVFVEDPVACDGCVVVVIGVMAVIRVPCNDGAGDILRGVEIRSCTPRFTTAGRRRPEVHAIPRDFGAPR